MTREEQLERQAQLLAIRKDAREKLAGIPGVLGVGVGFRHTGGETLDDVVWVVYVREKKVVEDLEPEALVPATLLGYPTDVLQAPRIDRLSVPDTEKYRPLKGGIQITNGKSIIETDPEDPTFQIMGAEYGTLGCFARDSEGRTVILSNAHAMGALGGGPGSPIGQPSVVTVCCCSCNVIGTVAKMEDNLLVDCGIATLAEDVAVLNEVAEIGALQGVAPFINEDGDGAEDQLYRVNVGDIVRKRGWATGLTTGKVIGLDGIVVEDEVVVKEDQIFIETSPLSDGAFADMGDSGAVIVNEAEQIVGLLFGRTPSKPTEGHANHIQHVMDALNITLDKEIGGASAMLSFPSPRASAEPKPEALLDALRERLESSPTGREILALVEAHRDEVLSLVNDRRPVTVAWRRHQGPAFVGAFLHGLRDPEKAMPSEHNGIPLLLLLQVMRKTLTEYGSPGLRSALRQYADRVLEVAGRFTTLEALLREIETAPSLGEASPEPERKAG